MPVKREGSTFALCRILGNDLPPLHSSTQTLANLRFILENEPELMRCTRSFILNRIVDQKRQNALRRLLTKAGLEFQVVEFDRREYEALKLPIERAGYLTNINGARNLAVEIALAQADVAMPFDGQIFFSAEAWSQLLSGVARHPNCPVFTVPMIRLMHNREALEPDHRQRPLDQGASEPQVMWRPSFDEWFDESMIYGRGSKAELLVRLGVPGIWDRWPGPWWTEVRARPLSPFAGKARPVGFWPGVRKRRRHKASTCSLLCPSAGLDRSRGPGRRELSASGCQTSERVRCSTRQKVLIVTLRKASHPPRQRRNAFVTLSS